MKRDIVFTGEGESKSSSYLWRHLIAHQKIYYQVSVDQNDKELLKAFLNTDMTQSGNLT